MRLPWCAAVLVAAIAALASACDRIVDLTPRVPDARSSIDAPLFDDGGIVFDDGGSMPDAPPVDGFPPLDALPLSDVLPLPDPLPPPGSRSPPEAHSPLVELGRVALPGQRRERSL